MIVSINQPAYMPWLGYLDRIAASDVHVVLDHVQFEKGSFVNRNRIRTPSGTAWLTVPVATSGQFGALPINELTWADGGRWRRKHLATIQANYARAPHYPPHQAFFSELLQTDREDSRFAPLTDELTRYLLDTFGIDTPLVPSHTLGIDTTKSELVLDICKALNATAYLSGPLGRNYLDVASFVRAGIDLHFHDYDPQPYAQCWPGFESHLAALDALSCLPPDEAASVMRSGRRMTARAGEN